MMSGGTWAHRRVELRGEAVAPLHRGDPAPPPFDNSVHCWSGLEQAQSPPTSVPVPPDGAYEQSPRDWAISTLCVRPRRLPPSLRGPAKPVFAAAGRRPVEPVNDSAWHASPPGVASALLAQTHPRESVSVEQLEIGQDTIPRERPDLAAGRAPRPSPLVTSGDRRSEAPRERTWPK
jgi:hypothetical protein